MMEVASKAKAFIYQPKVSVPSYLFIKNFVFRNDITCSRLIGIYNSSMYLLLKLELVGNCVVKVNDTECLFPYTVTVHDDTHTSFEVSELNMDLVLSCQDETRLIYEGMNYDNITLYVNCTRN